MKRPVLNRSRGSVVGMAMAIVMLLLVVGGALAVVSTLNLNLAAREEYAQRAVELARAGITQFLVDLDAGFIDSVTDPAPPTGLAVIIQQNFLQPVLPNPLASQRRLALTDPGVPAYPTPAFHGDGACYITFESGNAAGKPWSTWNADSEAPTPGYGGRLVPAFAVDVIATAQVGGVTRHLAVHAVRRWNYAIAAAQAIFLSTSGGYPTTITGDVYSRSQGTVAGTSTAVHVGAQYDPSAANLVGAATSGTVVNGRVLVANPDPASISVSPGNQVLGQQSNYRLVKFPTFEDVAVDSTWTDLTQYTKQHPAPDGSYLIPNRNNGTNGLPPTWYIDNARGAPMQLANGRYYVDGNLSILGPSKCTGLQLSQAQLKVKGSLVLTRRPTAVYGVQSALSVNKDFTFKWGFLQSDQATGFVISADRLVCEVGGEFHGLVIVRKGIYTTQLNLDDLTASPVVDAAGSQFAAFPEGRAGCGCCQCGCMGCFCQGCSCTSCCGCGGACCGGCCGSGPGPTACAPTCGDPGAGVAPCAGAYNLSGCCTSAAFSEPVSNPNSQFVNPATIAAVAPPGLIPITGGTGIAYPLHITGAILSPYEADIARGYPLIVSSVNVTWDPVYLKALNQHAPVETRSWEILP